MAASVGEPDNGCPVCKCELEDGSESDPVQLLVCGHRIHEYCWQGIAEHFRPDPEAGQATPKCPLCRLNTDDVARLEAEVIAQSEAAAVAEANYREAAAAAAAAAAAQEAAIEVGTPSPRVVLDPETEELFAEILRDNASEEEPTATPPSSTGASGSTTTEPSSASALSTGGGSAGGGNMAPPPPVAPASWTRTPRASRARAKVAAAPAHAPAVAAATPAETQPVAAIVPAQPRPVGTGGVPTFAIPSVFCCTCGQMCKIDKCRIKDKSKGTFRCDTCKCRVVQLYRDYGKWPVDEFKQFNEEEQQTFYSSIANCNSIAEIRAKVTDFITKHASQEDWYEEGGAYLPLAVWGKKGFPVDLIEEKTLQSDKIGHPILGTCYRVRILSKGNRGSTGWTRQIQMKNTSQKKLTAGMFKALAPAAGDGGDGGSGAATGGIEEGEEAGRKRKRSDDDSSSSSSSDSSSSSSSDKKKKKKKAKKSKKDKKKAKKAAKKEAKKKKQEKADEARRKKEEQLSTKESEARKKNAQAIYDKLNPVVAACGATISKPGYLHVPQIMKEPLEASYMQLNEIYRKMDKCRKEESTEMPDHVSCVKDHSLNQNSFELNET